MPGAKVLIVGRGARDNALAHAYARSPHVDRVYVAPGNAGSEFLEKTARLGTSDIDELIGFVKKNGVSIVDVGSEEPLTIGRIVDRFHDAGFDRVVGQVSDAGILETSKCWAKEFFDRHGIPIPEYVNFDDPEEARRYISRFYGENPGENVVVKADGICGGKGSLVCDSLEQALIAVDRIMVKREFDSEEKGIRAGDRVVVERRMHGIEMMFFVYTDGEAVKFAGTAYDLKRAYDHGHPHLTTRWFIENFGRFNPNTGGMISTSPHPYEEKFREETMETIAVPTLKIFQEETGHRYTGVGYFGLMLSEEGGELVPRVEEFNRRHGDPEGSSILPRIETDYYELMDSLLRGELRNVDIEFSPVHTYALVAVSGPWVPAVGKRDDRFEYPGYPGDHHTNQPINGLEDVDCLVYHSGTELDGDTLKTTGGRVLEIVGTGGSLEEAKADAEDNRRRVFFKGIRSRREHVEPEGMFRPHELTGWSSEEAYRRAYEKLEKY